MRSLLVGGDWGDHPRASGYIKRLCTAMDGDIEYVNGGTYDDLKNIVEDVTSFDVVYWFPNICNSEEKLIDRIKKINYRCILVMSKSNFDKRYDTHLLIGKMLKIKANLLVEFTGCRENINGSVIDPLGNCFLSEESDCCRIASIIQKRVADLCSFTRIGSMKVGDSPAVLPDKPLFFEHVKKHSYTFHNLIHAINQDRLLGNLSFRCERGFPSFRSDESLFVSRRNIDKRFIGPEGMVKINNNIDKIQYYGDFKPSVDTPIQILLYQYYKNVNFILHSHVYIDGAPFTNKVLPCGVLEEADEIKKIYPDQLHDDFYINLLGHGSLVLSSNDSYFDNIPYVPRPVPEFQII